MAGGKKGAPKKKIGLKDGRVTPYTAPGKKVKPKRKKRKSRDAARTARTSAAQKAASASAKKKTAASRKAGPGVAKPKKKAPARDRKDPAVEKFNREYKASLKKHGDAKKAKTKGVKQTMISGRKRK